MNDQSQTAKPLVPASSDNQLALPQKIVDRGLKLALRIERQLDLARSQRPTRFFAGLDEPSQIAFSKNGKFAAITGQVCPAGGECLKDVVVWNAETGEITVLSALKRGYTNMGQEDGAIWDLALSSTGDLALVGYDDGDVLCWDVKRNEVLYRITGSWMLDVVQCLMFIPGDQSFVYSVGALLSIHNTQSGDYVGVIDNSSCPITAVFSDDGSKLLAKCAIAGESLKLVDVLGKQEPIYFKDTATIKGLAILPDNQKVLSLYRNGLITVWNAQNGAEISHWVHTPSVPDKFNQCPEKYKERCLFGADPGVSRPPHSKLLQSCQYGSIAISPDGRKVLSGGACRTMRLSTLDGQEICQYSHTAPVIKVAFSSDGRYALAGCYDGSVYLWELPASHQEELSIQALSG